MFYGTDFNDQDVAAFSFYSNQNLFFNWKYLEDQKKRFIYSVLLDEALLAY